MMNTAATPGWPVKTRDMFTHHIKSARWKDIVFRDDDIVIATYAKSGTTWTQQIVSQLIFKGAEDINIHHLSPWVDNRVMPSELIDGLARQTHRRFMKTHLPVDALRFSPQARYIYIARDGRDAAWSFHNHHFNGNEDYFRVYNEGLPEGFPVLERGPEDPYEFYKAWLEGDGYPMWPFWTHVRSWWNIRGLPNVMLIHFSDMKSDLPGSIRRIADFLGISVDDATMERIVDHCSFDYMKKHAADMAPRGGIMFKGGADTFINKGSNGRWRDMLTAQDIAAYEARAVAELGPDCARWLEHGGPIPD
jgi:aryl sulfotransferase